MPEASSRIAELIKEWGLLKEEEALLEEQRESYASGLKKILRWMMYYSIHDTSLNKTAYLNGNTRYWLIYRCESMTQELTGIKARIGRLANRIENLKKQNEENP